jgi:hypothetical protein
MWDILNFLKNPSGDNPKDKNIHSATAKLREINAQIEDAVENPGRERPEPEPERKGEPNASADIPPQGIREPKPKPHREREQKGARHSEKQTEAVKKI